MAKETVLGQNLIKLLKEHNKKQSDLMKFILEKEKLESKDRTNFSRYINGKIDFPMDYLEKTADFFKTDISTLLNIDFNSKPVKKVPITGTASCGAIESNHFQEENKFAYYNGDFYTASLYCIIANGDSMAPEIEDGDEVICDPDVTVQNGDIVHYTLGGESAIKVYFKDEEAFIAQFIPYNPTPDFKTRTIRLDDNEANEIKVTKVVAINKLKFNNRLSRLKLIGKA